jgi:GT2 family glycosyltransferase
MQLPPKEIRTVLSMTILAIIVIYRRSPMESSSLTTLMSSAKQAEGLGLRLKLMVADNTPGGQTISDLPAAVTYRAYPENPGLALPYNDALAVAMEEGFDWLLTLDQDTHLPEEFLAGMACAAQAYAEHREVAAVVPHVEDVGRLISPFYFARGFLPTVLPASACGIAPLHTSALNSASLLRVRSLLEQGGYDPSFPLHNSDTRLYQRLDDAGKRVAIADVTIQHELSILRREERMSPDRYQLMLMDECRFWDLHMGLLARIERITRLLGRYVKGLIHKENPAFQHITFSELKYRLLTRRANRLSRVTLPQSNPAI